MDATNALSRVGREQSIAATWLRADYRDSAESTIVLVVDFGEAMNLIATGK